MKTRLTNRTERLESIERLLLENQRGLRVVEIAEACHVDRRTVYRDIKKLKELGLPIYQKNGRFCINREYYLATVRLSVNEAIALLLAVRSLAHHAAQQNPHLISGLKKLGAALPDLPATHIQHLASRMREYPVDRGFVTVLDTITRGWCEARLVELWSTSPRQHETGGTQFATYFIEMTPNGGVQAIGFDRRSQQVRTVNLRRVVRAKLLRTTFQPPPEFDPRPYLSSLWQNSEKETSTQYDVVLVFAADVAAIIQEYSWNPLHPSQRIDTLSDGRCRLHVRVKDWKKMLPWIRSWGMSVEAVAPAILRKYLEEEAQAALARYKDNQAG